MLIMATLLGNCSIFLVVSSLWTMPAKLYIRPTKLEPQNRSLHLGQIRQRAGPLWSGGSRVRGHESEDPHRR